MTVVPEAPRPRLPQRALTWLGVLRDDATALERRLVVGAFVLVVAGWLVGLVFMSDVPYIGDELHYASDAAATADLLTGRGGSVGTVARKLVGVGWFMPGMSLILTPVFMAHPDASIGFVRAYASVLTFLLWLWTLREFAKTFGPSAVTALLAFPSLAVMWMMFTSTVWGDLGAGLVLAIATLRTYRIAVDIVSERAIRLRDVVVLELLLTAAVYLRGNTIVLVLAVHVVLFGFAVIAGRWKALLRHTAVLVAGAGMFVALLAPWSLAATRVVGERVVTTTYIPLSLVLTFGDLEEICSGPCVPPGTPNRDSVVVQRPFVQQYSQAYATEHGISRLQTHWLLVDEAFAAITPRAYAAQVGENFGRFTREPTEFATTFATKREADTSDATERLITQVTHWLTLALYVPFFAALVAANAAVVVRSRRLQVLSLCVKAATIALFVQPFVHRSHGRYWVAFAPVMTISAVMLLAWWATRAPQFATRVGLVGLVSDDTETEVARSAGPDRTARIMIVLQGLYVALIAAAAAFIWWA